MSCAHYRDRMAKDNRVMNIEHPTSNIE